MIQHHTVPVIIGTHLFGSKDGRQSDDTMRGHHEPGSWPRENEGSILVQMSSTNALKQVSKLQPPPPDSDSTHSVVLTTLMPFLLMNLRNLRLVRSRLK